MRISRVLPIAVVGAVLIGVIVLIVVEVANYDGRTQAEIVRDERGENPVSLTHCPKDELGNSEEEHDPGSKGETVPPTPTSALLCNWTYQAVGGGKPALVPSETVLHRGVVLTKLTDALNSLPPMMPLPEGEYAQGEYACPSEESIYILVGLRYAGSSEVHVGIGPALCGGYAALNLENEKEYVATPRLLRLLDRLVHPAS
jgi:hypothetical protein